VQTQNTKKGRPRKVIQQGKAKLSFTGKVVTSHAGMALVARAIDHFYVHDELKNTTADLDVNKQHQTSRLLEQLITLRMLGGEALNDIAQLNDPALEALFEWGNIAHPCTFGRRLGEMRWVHNLGLERIVTKLSDCVANTGQRLVAIDSTVTSVFGNQIQGAERGYNPHKPGRDSYHPILAVDVDTRSVVDGYLRPGSCASGHDLKGFVSKLLAESTHPIDQTTFRLDKGLTAGSVLDIIEEKNAGYLAKVKLTAKVAGQISKIKHWRAFGKGHFAANIYCQLDGWSRPRRMTVIERHLPAQEQLAQLPLFEMMAGRYEVVVTNLHLNAENIWRLYNRFGQLHDFILFVISIPLTAIFTSGTKAAATLSDLIPVLNNLGMASIRLASSPQMDTGVSPDSFTTSSISRKTAG
jgi:hypothetical protein